MHASGFFSDLLKLERVGNGDEGRFECDNGRSSPKRHWPQKAAVAHAATAASKGELRLRFWISRTSIVVLTGGRGTCLEEVGAELCTPLKTYRSLVLPFHRTL